MNNIKNGSWLVHLLSEKFPVVDICNQPVTQELFNFSKETVVTFDTEMVCGDKKNLIKFLAFSKHLKDAVWIVQILDVYNLLKKLDYNVVYEPAMNSMDEILGLKNTNKIQPYYDNSKNYFCLNRNYNTVREQTLKNLNTFRLIEFGYVTAHSSKFATLPGVETPAMNHYKTTSNLGYERCQPGDNTSINIKNFHIVSKLPGNIAVSIESGWHLINNFKTFMETEKSIMPYAVQRIPLILGNKNVNKKYKNDGFDIFDDIVDYSYDSMDFDDIQKPYIMIKNNEKLLKNGVDLDKIKPRLEKNYNFLINDWVDNKIDNLIKEIKKFKF